MTELLDPIRLEVLRHSIVAAAQEMSIVIARTSRSTTVREMLDYSTAVFDAKGRNIGQSARIPMHLNTMAPFLEEILAKYIPASEWREGDVVISNDPYCGGQHLPDIGTFQPIFYEGELIGFTGSMAHHTDVGGAAPGSYNAGATQIFAEGLRIPPVKLVEGGRHNEAIWKLILQNVREREMLRGDLLSQVAALQIGARNIVAIAEKVGKAALVEAADKIIAHSEAGMRRAIEGVPDGTYSFTDYIDDDGINQEPIKISVVLSVHGDTMTVDFRDSSDQVDGPINCTFNIARSAIYYAIMAGIGSDIPANSGCYAPIEVVARPGSIVHAAEPSPVTNRSATAHRVINSIMGALAQAMPERIPAAYYGVSYVYALETVAATGDRRVYFDAEVGGWGGEAKRDGSSALSGGLHNLAAVPMEMLESSYPITFTSYALRNGSGGEGRHRGGLGLVREWRLDAARGSLSAAFDRFKFGPFGLEGGKAGKVGNFELIRKDGSVEKMPSKVTGIKLRQGDRVRMETSGGGGYGDPAERSAEARQADAVNRYV